MQYLVKSLAGSGRCTFNQPMQVTVGTSFGRSCAYLAGIHHMQRCWLCVHVLDGNREELNTGTFGKPDFLSAVKAEANATRGGVGIFDQSSFAKFSVAGPGACALLQWLCGNNVDVDIGRVVRSALPRWGCRWRETR